MLKRIMNCICHPRLLGLYYKDSALRVIGALLCVFVVFMGLSVGIATNTEHFTYDDTKIITNLVIHNEEANIEFDSRTSTITGTSVKMESDSFIIDFLSTENYSKSSKMVFRFNAKEMDFIYQGFVIGSYNYSDYDVDDFNLLLVQAGEISNTLDFQDLLYEIFSDINPNYSIIVIISDAMICLVYYFIVLAVALAASYFRNPDIAFKVRAKLCLYSTLVYFVVMIFGFLYSARWLQYVALFLPIVYTNITFSRIIRVKSKVE